MNAIEIEALKKEYKDVVAVDDLSLTVREGEIFSLLGVNGAGKTTTIKMLAGLTLPTSGDARIFGHSIRTDSDKIKGLLDISMQETAIARKLTVEENIDFYAALNGTARWGWTRLQISAPLSCRAVGKESFPSRLRWSRAPNCSFWMNPRWGWTFWQGVTFGR